MNQEQDRGLSTPDAAAGFVLRLTLDLPEGKPYLAGLRRTVRSLLESVGVLGQDVDDIEIMLGELATNAVVHAQAGSYRVEIEFYGDRVLVTVSDRGQGFPAWHAPSPGTLRPDSMASGCASERYGGWGLPLVYSIADHVEILPAVPQGTTIRAIKRLDGLDDFDT